MKSLNLIPALADLMGAQPSESTEPYLSILVVFPALVALAIWLVPAVRKSGRQVAIGASLFELAVLVYIAIRFDWTQAATTQFFESYTWIPQLGVTWSLGFGALGLVMALLAGLLVPLVLVAAKNEDDDPRRSGGYAALILVLYSFIILIFSAYDLVVFYIAFEAMLIPLFFMIARYGRGENRAKAAMKFLLYSLFGGLIMLGGIIVIFALFGALDGNLYRYDTLQLALPLIPLGWQLAIFIPLFLAFAIKAPMVPLHTWLPDAAASARPGTSVLLVGILDKIGTYGMIVLGVALLPAATEAARPIILVFAVISILWGGFAANGQKNLLRLVSFTSVSHFGFMVLGIFIGSEIALTGAMFYMVAHGLSIAGLFLISGFLIDRGNNASVMDYGGMQRVTPVIAGTWLFAGLASIALPGLSGFVPEFLILMGTYKVSIPLAIFAVFGVILAALYILMPYQRIFTGKINPEKAMLTDMDTRERFVVAPLIAGMLILGIWAAPLIGALNQVSDSLAPKMASWGVSASAEASSSAIDSGALSNTETAVSTTEITMGMAANTDEGNAK